MNFSADLKKFIHSKQFIDRFILVLIGCYLLYILTLLHSYLFALPLKYEQIDMGFDFFLKYVTISNGFESIFLYPWVVLTHYFIHSSFVELLFNIIVIYLSSKLFLQFWSNFRLILLLVLSLLAGVFVFSLTSPYLSNLYTYHGVGASAFALISCMFIIVPQHKFRLHPLLRLPIKYLFVITLIVNFLLFYSNQASTFYAHIAGAGVGILFALFYKNIVDNYYLFQHRQKEKKFNKRSKTEYKRPISDEEYNVEQKSKQDKIDAILEKISQKGYDSLSTEEKDFLFNESKRT